MSGSETRPPAAVIFGCKGARLGGDERRFFAETQPLGFILFKRNCETPEQLRALVADLRESVGRPGAPVLVDQEGGRVARLTPPHWREAPAAAVFGALAQRDLAAAREAARVNARLIAAELHDLGIDVDCIPLLDVRAPGLHDSIGDRAFADDTDVVAALGRAVCEGLLAGGVLPVVKHVPGYGRALVDSHVELPVVDAARADLEAVDFAPFKALNDMPLAMTAHVLCRAVDGNAPATVSPLVVGEVIRGFIGFDGLLMTDDLSMEALGGAIGARAHAALAAGCDVALHCNGKLDEMREVAAAVRPLDDAGLERWRRAAAMRQAPEPFDAAAALARLDALLAGL
ncbi:MAG: beta-N-acetylhexosaminidase [Alphaproteobacteria bacterium]